MLFAKWTGPFTVRQALSSLKSARHWVGVTLAMLRSLGATVYPPSVRWVSGSRQLPTLLRLPYSLKNTQVNNNY